MNNFSFFPCEKVKKNVYQKPHRRGEKERRKQTESHMILSWWKQNKQTNEKAQKRRINYGWKKEGKIIKKKLEKL